MSFTLLVIIYIINICATMMPFNTDAVEIDNCLFVYMYKIANRIFHQYRIKNVRHSSDFRTHLMHVSVLLNSNIIVKVE